MTRLRFLALAALVAVAGCSAENDPGPTGVSLERLEQSTTEIQSLAGVAGSVTGSAHIQVFGIQGLGLRKLTFSAIRAADGTVRGEWNIVAGASIIHGDVDCLNILPGGQVARLSGVVTSAKFTSFQPGTAFAIQVVDNGAGQSGAADETSEVRAFQNLPPEVGRIFCETGEAPSDVDIMGIELGNITIHVDPVP